LDSQLIPANTKEPSFIFSKYDINDTNETRDFACIGVINLIQYLAIRNKSHNYKNK